ncbi:MAG: PAC2 family protein [Nanoarchaeota archaeon]|nr:PAC2 family protein [Nanoarchaeota archaeon]
MNWQVTKSKNIIPKNPTLIEGLPGIGNVGKIAADILVDDLKAVKILEFFSYSLPNSVFVNENNLVELPKIEMFYKKIGQKDFLFLVGDAQPTSEQASYEFSEKVLDIVNEYGCKNLVTLGGIGLAEIPKHPKVFCTGNDKGWIKEFKQLGAHTNIYGIVGPIIGVSGLLLGLGKKRGVKAAALLSETYGHPMYIGLSGAREMLKILMKKYPFKIDLNELNKEIHALEREMTQQISSQPLAKKYLKYKDTNYIG